MTKEQLFLSIYAVVALATLCITILIVTNKGPDTEVYCNEEFCRYVRTGQGANTHDILMYENVYPDGRVKYLGAKRK